MICVCFGADHRSPAQSAIAVAVAVVGRVWVNIEVDLENWIIMATV